MRGFYFSGTDQRGYFDIQMEIPFYCWFILLSAAAGFFALAKKVLPHYLVVFPVFLLFTAIVEVLGFNLAAQNLSNVDLYNFTSVAAYTYYLYLIMNFVNSARAKKAIWWTMTGYAAVSLVNIIFIQRLNVFHTITFSIGCLLLVVVAIYYFYELLLLPRAIDLRREPSFYIVTALLFFYLCSLPLIGAVNYIFSLPEIINRTYDQLINILNVLLYSLFTIGFLCRINIRRRTSLS